MVKYGENWCIVGWFSVAYRFEYVASLIVGGHGVECLQPYSVSGFFEMY